MSLRPAVFLDRDGTLNREVSYLTRPDELELLPGAGQAVARLREAGYAVVVVTNQSAVARGFMTEADLGIVHREFQNMLARCGAELDGIYYCPHHPECGNPPYRQDCTCRKPGPGLLLRAAAELGLDLARSVMVGDKLSDLQAGWNAGCRTVLVLTSYGEAHRATADAKTLARIDHIAPTLSDAADWMLCPNT